ncbi:MAG: acyltransferase family protein, partial [Lachnospiraceae bacterium]|nr:acyltransferase family protein [Lachnospiraceae bacterium]
SYDIARGIAIYLIAIAHVLRTGMVLSTIGVSVLSVFVFISGRNAACSSAFHLPLLSLLKKKFLNLLPSYFFCAGLSVVVFLALGRFAGSASDFSLPKGVFQILYANSKHDGMKWNTALWFLPCLFMLFLLAVWMLQVHPFPRLWMILTLRPTVFRSSGSPGRSRAPFICCRCSSWVFSSKVPVCKRNFML